MNILLHLVSRLYPKWWQERYGDEFNALLEEARPGIGGVLNILKGAFLMHFSYHNNSLRILGLTTVVGLVVVSIFGLTMDRQFRSTSTVQTQMSENATHQDTAESFRRMVGLVISRESLSQIADNHNLYPDLDSTERLERMKKGIEIQVDSIPDKQDRISAISISFVYPERTVVNRVTNELTSRFLSTMFEQKTLATGEGLAPAISRLTVLDPASLPDTPIQPAWGMILAMGFVGGLGIGFVLILLRRLTHRAKLPPNGSPVPTEK